MTGIATGGFSVHAESIGHYGSPLIEYATVPVMVQANANPLIVEELREWRGNAISLTDKKLHDVLDDLWVWPQSGCRTVSKRFHAWLAECAV